MLWIEGQWQKLQRIKIKFNPWSFENNSDFKQCCVSFFIDSILKKVIGVNSTQSIKTCFCSFDICTKMQRGWFESDFYGRLGRYRRGALCNTLQWSQRGNDKLNLQLLIVFLLNKHQAGENVTRGKRESERPRILFCDFL